MQTVPYSVRRGRWNVDGQHAVALLHFYSEEKRSVGHLLHLLLYELRLSGLLKILRLCDLVHKAHDLAWPVSSDETAG